MCFIGAPYPSIPGRSDCSTTLHVVDLHSLSHHLLRSTTTKKELWIPMMILMRTRFVLTVGNPFPHTVPGTNTCREVFATRLCPGPQCHLGTLRHPIFLRLSCWKKTTRVSWWDTTARILSINFFSSAFHHWLFNVRYRISQLLSISNTEVYPILSHCTIPGGINVCPTTDTDRVRLQVLLAAKNHGVNQISVPKTG